MPDARSKMEKGVFGWLGIGFVGSSWRLMESRIVSQKSGDADLGKNPLIVFCSAMLFRGARDLITAKWLNMPARQSGELGLRHRITLPYCETCHVGFGSPKVKATLDASLFADFPSW